MTGCGPFGGGRRIVARAHEPTDGTDGDGEHLARVAFDKRAFEARREAPKRQVELPRRLLRRVPFVLRLDEEGTDDVARTELWKKMTKLPVDTHASTIA